MNIFTSLFLLISLSALYINDLVAELHNLDGTVLENVEHQSIIALWPKGTAGVNQDIPEQSKPCGMRFFDIHNPNITVYKPGKANGVAVVLCSGGGYNYIASGVEGVPTAEKLNKSGITVFVLKYRLPRTHGVDFKYPVPVSDVLRSVQLVRVHADQFNIDTQKIGIMGFSAGGHLASSAGTLFNKVKYDNDDISHISPRPDFMCLVYPVISTRKDIVHGCIFSLVRDTSDTQAIACLSNELNVTGETPPTFIAHAKDDRSVMVQHSILMFEALKKHNVPAELRLYEEGGHGFGIGRTGTDSVKWIDDFIGWLFKMQFIPKTEFDNKPDTNR
jgi:acetyl esterase/lipase